MEKLDPLYQGNFKYVLIPADSFQPIIENEAPKSGGLEKDALRILAENQFRDSSVISSSVEIVSLLLPSADYNYVGVSMYCDQNGKTKGLPVNLRATSIASMCNHNEQIHGDVYFGKYHDDESQPWVRLDFTIDEVSSDSEWLKMAKTKNAGSRSGAYSTSGVLQNMLKQGNTQFINAGDEREDAVKEESDSLSWSQTTEEVEVRIKLQGVFKASDFTIVMKPNQLQTKFKSGDSIPALDGKFSQLSQVGGAALSGPIDVDSSSWEIEKSKDGKETLLIFTLVKANSQRWLNLLRN